MTAKTINFPGVTRSTPEKLPEEFGPFSEEGTLDGILVSVSDADSDQIVRIQLQNGKTRYTCIETDREIARRIARHMHEPVRVSGIGEWLRNREGTWILEKFKVEKYDVLEADDLIDVINMMRQIEGSEWKSMDDSISAMRELRENSSSLH